MDNTTWKIFYNVLISEYINVELLDCCALYKYVLYSVTQITQVFALISSLLKKWHTCYYRATMSALILFIFSKFWATADAFHHEDFTNAFICGGFIAWWITTQSFMWTVGDIDENVLSTTFIDNQVYLRFWALGFVIIPVAFTFIPFVLYNAFYRYSYVTITKVIFIDIFKCHVSRTYGILIVWIG